MRKGDAIAMSDGMGPNRPGPRNVTYAKLNEAGTYYWANPNIRVLDSDWALILDDNVKGRLRLFIIPAGSIDLSELCVRRDKPTVIDLRIKPGSFEDIPSGYSFLRYLKETIEYPITRDSNEMTKSDAIELFNKMGYRLENAITTYARLNEARTFFWANPNIRLLSKDWTLILDDDVKCRLYIFSIPAGSIDLSELRVRRDKPTLINLRIKPGSFEDLDSEYSFLRYLVKTIEYPANDTEDTAPGTGGSGSAKHDAIDLFNQMGYRLENRSTTYAKLNEAGTYYWANPNIRVLDADWALILYDNVKGKLRLFKIPAGSIDLSELCVRRDKPIVIDLRIKPGSFEDIASGYSFLRYLVETAECSSNTTEGDGANRRGITYYAERDGTGAYYRVKLNTGDLEKDWAMILNDKENKRLHIFKIPAGRIRHDELCTAMGVNALNLRISCDDFTDIGGGYSFRRFLTEKIEYISEGGFSDSFGGK